MTEGSAIRAPLYLPVPARDIYDREPCGRGRLAEGERVRGRAGEGSGGALESLPARRYKRGAFPDNPEPTWPSSAPSRSSSPTPRGATSPARSTPLIEKAGLRIVAQKRLRMTREQAETFYAVHKERPFFGELVEFMTSGPVVVQVLEGENAVAKYREIMGATNPANAAEGTIRKHFAESVGENSVHGSDSAGERRRSRSQFFSGTRSSGRPPPARSRSERWGRADSGEARAGRGVAPPGAMPMKRRSRRWHAPAGRGPDRGRGSGATRTPSHPRANARRGGPTRGQGRERFGVLAHHGRHRHRHFSASSSGSWRVIVGPRRMPRRRAARLALRETARGPLRPRPGQRPGRRPGRARLPPATEFPPPRPLANRRGRVIWRVPSFPQAPRRSANSRASTHQFRMGKPMRRQAGGPSGALEGASFGRSGRVLSETAGASGARPGA